MKRGWVVCLLPALAGALLVSCAGPSDGGGAAVPAPAGDPDPAAGPSAAPSLPDAPDTLGKPKLWSGSVRFVGFSDGQLDELRVVPESTSTVYRPMNALYRGVDGFWWKPDRKHWFKIPGHCEVVVWPTGYDGETPQVEAPDEELLAGNGRPRTWTKCKSWLTQALLWNGRPHKPGWYPNAGRTGIGTAYPW